MTHDTWQSGSGGGGGKSKEELVLEVASQLRKRLPEPFDMEEAMIKYPTQWSESMNTVITQELERFNSLTVRLLASPLLFATLLLTLHPLSDMMYSIPYVEFGILSSTRRIHAYARGRRLFHGVHILCVS